MQLSDFDGSVLTETIPDFHNTEKRLETLFAHASDDSCGRVKDAEAEITYIRSVCDKSCTLCRRYYSGDFLVRVTHNDIKSNNVLFDKPTLKSIAVIDLDTVMSCMAINDFGDAVRFIANTANEDEANLSKGSFVVVKFKAFCEGY